MDTQTKEEMRQELAELEAKLDEAVIQLYDMSFIDKILGFFGILRIDLDEGNMILLYTFPQPEDATEARYGAVLINQSTKDLNYFTLEASYGDIWAVCSRDTSMHSCLDFWDSADKDKFVEWVKGRIQ